MKNDSLATLQLYRLTKLKAKLDVSGSSIWAWVKAGKFPKPIKLGDNCTAWKADDIDAWVASRVLASQEERV